VAIARVEQLAPFQNSALRAVFGNYPNLAEIVWLQEEPKNMGAWTYMAPRLQELTEGKVAIRYEGRPERASPAEGSADRHAEEQARIVAAAFADAPEPAARSRPNGRASARNGAATKRREKQAASS
jgi:2-oxoglutarate dehydrogenase E1 component